MATKQKQFKSPLRQLEANRRYRERNRELLNKKAKERMRLKAKAKQSTPGESSAQYARICPECGTGFVTNIQNKICCQRSCTEAQWRKKNPERLISAAEVRREEGLIDYTRTKRRNQPSDADILKSVMASLAPDVLAVCLKVRAQNRSKRQTQITAAATGD